MSVDLDERRDGEQIAREQEEAVRALVPVQAAVRGVDEHELLAETTLPGADLSAESLTIVVRPQQHDEFRCGRCFLVLHRARLHADGLCRDCA